MSVAIQHYPVKVEFVKYMTRGILEGLKFTETLGFVAWDDACSWAAAATESPLCDFVVLEMINLETGETENF